MKHLILFLFLILTKENIFSSSTEKYRLEQNSQTKNDSFSQRYGKHFVSSIPLKKFSGLATVWTQKQNKPYEYDNENIRDQFQTDVAIWFQTLFSLTDKVGGKTLSHQEVIQLHQRIKFLKRLFLLLAYAPLKYIPQKSFSIQELSHSIFEKPFPFPLASALSHGQRILISFFSNPHQPTLNTQLLNVLLTGNQNTQSNILETRSFASHGVSQHNNKQLREDKLVIGLMGALKRDHKMIDIPIGGVGNKNELNYFIGPTGKSYTSTSQKSVDNYQQGHLFIAKHKFNDGISSLLLGLESTAPYKKSPFLNGSKIHSIKSGLEDETVFRAALGGQKWKKLLGQNAPAQYGGMRITFHDYDFLMLDLICEEVLSWDEEEQMKFFLEVLSMNANEAHHFLSNHKKLTYFFL